MRSSGKAAIAGTFTGFVFGAFGVTNAARADVVPPPSVVCAPNERAVPDHGGGHCEAVSCPPGKVLARGLHYWNECLEPPPKTCPAGWTPVPGATCLLARCDETTPCAAGTACRATPVCTKDGMGFGQSDPSEAPRSLFAAPRAPRPLREYVGACDAKNACTPLGQECRTVRVCLPPGGGGVAPRPANARSATVVATYGRSLEGEPAITDATPSSGGPSSAMPPAASVAPASPPNTAPAPPAEPPRTDPLPPQSGRGGAGCAAAPVGVTTGGAVAAFLATAFALAATRRRRAR